MESPESRFADVGLRWASEQAIYGTVVVSSVIVTASKVSEGIVDMLLLVLGTMFVFWAAHVYSTAAGELAQGITDPDGFWYPLRRALGESKGILTSALLPTLVLLLGVLGVLDENTAVWTALIVGVVVLAVVGYLIFQRHKRPVWECLVSGCVSAAFGLVLIALKVLIH